MITQTENKVLFLHTNRELLPERRTFDYYPTPLTTISSALDRLDITPKYVLDPGAGAGAWGEEVHRRWPGAHLYGAEAQMLPAHPDYGSWVHGDFADYEPEVRFDLVVGNPPYAHAESFVRRSLSFCNPGGVVAFLLRLAFLEGQARRDGLFTEHPPYEVSVCSKRPSFTGDGKTNATAFAMIYWTPNFRGETRLSWLK